MKDQVLFESFGDSPPIRIRIEFGDQLIDSEVDEVICVVPADPQHLVLTAGNGLELAAMTSSLFRSVLQLKGAEVALALLEYVRGDVMQELMDSALDDEISK